MLIDRATNHRASVDQVLQDAVSASANQPGTINMNANARLRRAALKRSS